MTDEPISAEKRWILFLYVPVAFLVIIVLGVVFENDKTIASIFDIVATLALNVLAFAWCRVDADERGYELHRFFPFAMIIFGTLTLLYYIFRSRGFVGGLTSTGWLVLYTACCFVVSTLIGGLIILLLVQVGVVPGGVFTQQ